MQRRTDQDVIAQLTVLRERGDIPWDAIVDETRSSMISPTGLRSPRRRPRSSTIITLIRGSAMRR